MKDLIEKLLRKDPKKRISLDEALAHPWIEAHCANSGSAKISDHVFKNLRKYHTEHKLKRLAVS